MTSLIGIPMVDLKRPVTMLSKGAGHKMIEVLSVEEKMCHAFQNPPGKSPYID